MVSAISVLGPLMFVTYKNDIEVDVDVDDQGC